MSPLAGRREDVRPASPWCHRVEKPFPLCEMTMFSYDGGLSLWGRRISRPVQRSRIGFGPRAARPEPEYASRRSPQRGGRLRDVSSARRRNSRGGSQARSCHQARKRSIGRIPVRLRHAAQVRVLASGSSPSLPALESVVHPMGGQGTRAVEVHLGRQCLLPVGQILDRLGPIARRLRHKRRLRRQGKKGVTAEPERERVLTFVGYGKGDGEALIVDGDLLCRQNRHKGCRRLAAWRKVRSSCVCECVVGDHKPSQPSPCR